MIRRISIALFLLVFCASAFAAKLALVRGATSQVVYVFVQDSSVSTGAGLTGLVYNSGSLTAYYVRPLATPVAISLITQTVTGAYSSGGFVAVDGTNMPGLYRVDIPDAALAVGVPGVVVMLKGAANMAPSLLEIQLVVQDPNATLASVDVTNWKGSAAPAMTGDAFARLGTPAGASVSADVAAIKSDSGAIKTKTDYLPSATAGAAGGVFIAGSNAATTVNFTGNLSGSVGSVTTVSDKTGYALAASTSDAVLAGAIWNALTASYGSANTYGAFVESFPTPGPTITPVPTQYPTITPIATPVPVSSFNNLSKQDVADAMTIEATPTPAANSVISRLAAIPVATQYPTITPIPTQYPTITPIATPYPTITAIPTPVSASAIALANWEYGTRALTGAVTLATSQPNYAPAKAGDSMVSSNERGTDSAMLAASYTAPPTVAQILAGIVDGTVDLKTALKRLLAAVYNKATITGTTTKTLTIFASDNVTTIGTQAISSTGRVTTSQ